ncbi:MAG: ParB N-terminal domain-containing protein, partial [Chloroflexi bacterium]|nr:ParB N-terminal domain-containing protein [Chloroflexota bacterium]
MGDLVKLACSIGTCGLLQPVGITKDNELVFGHRRLLACKDILGWQEIDVRVVDVQSITQGENDENEIRKDFTPSERVAIAETIKAEIGNRQGCRTDLQPVDNGPQVPHGAKTRDVVAKKAGFGSGKEYDRARKVVDTAEPEVVEAMDKGDMSISRAARVADLPPEQQREVVDLP